jgi:hypothetical protein
MTDVGLIVTGKKRKTLPIPILFNRLSLSGCVIENFLKHKFFALISLLLLEIDGCKLYAQLFRLTEF